MARRSSSSWTGSSGSLQESGPYGLLFRKRVCKSSRVIRSSRSVHRSSSQLFVRVAVVLALLLPAARASAQQQPQTPSRPAQVRAGDTTLVADTIPKEDHTARSAFAKALILPGWGHFSIGANRRGMVFVALEGTS